VIKANIIHTKFIVVQVGELGLVFVVGILRGFGFSSSSRVVSSDVVVVAVPTSSRVDANAMVSMSMTSRVICHIDLSAG
jgi:hypothetical protein